jgi:DUF1009 family protein
VIDAAKAQERDIFVVALQGHADATMLDSVSHQWVEMAELSRILEIFRRENVQDIVMAGGISRPPLSAFKPSLLTTKLLARIGKAYFGGDDTLLKAVIGVLEEEGFQVLGADAIVSDAVTPHGILTLAQPSPQAAEDIALGVQMLRDLSKWDMGQAVVLRNRQILGVEALEGTAALIHRCGALAAEQNPAPYRGVLVKARKTEQEKRVDLPAIGVETIQQLHQAGLAGVALEARGSLMISKAAILQQANAQGLFVMGF